VDIAYFFIFKIVKQAVFCVLSQNLTRSESKVKLTYVSLCISLLCDYFR